MSQNYTKKGIFYLLLLSSFILILEIIRFNKTGISTIKDTISLYSVPLLFSLYFFNNQKVIKYNIITIILILFTFELFIIEFKKGILNHEELIGLKRYSSPYFKKYKYGMDEYNNLIGLPNSSFIHENIDFKFETAYNSYGLRNPEIDTLKIKNSNSIIVLGDSFTEGNGTPQDSTMPALLEKKLKVKDTDYLVINGGAAGSDPVFSFKLYNTKLKSLQPQTIILAINSSDILDLMFRKGMDRFVEEKIETYKAPWWEYFYASSRIARLILVNIFKIDPYLLIPQKKVAERYQKAYGEFLDIINKFKEESEKQESKFIIVYTPHIFEFKNQQRKIHMNDTFSQMLKDDYNKGLLPKKFIFLQDSIIKYHLFDTSTLNNYYWSHDYHFQPIGYDIWADVMAKEFPLN